MKTNIPLSWSQTDIKYPKFYSVKLRLSGLPWVYSAEIPSNYNQEDLCNELELVFPKGFLLRGCSSELAKYLSDKGYEIIRTGAEGLIDLSLLNKLPKSVTELVKRGNRVGAVKEISLSEKNRYRVTQFIKHTHYGSKPRLQYLFRNTFESNTRCFVFSNHNQEWQGIVTVSVLGEKAYNTEMILRHKRAPVGVMEALFISVMNILRSEGYKHFSLGEVPFVTPEGMKEDDISMGLIRSFSEALLFKSGNLLKFSFNYKGLFNFKNKFTPEWKPVYICASPKLPLLSLLDLFLQTNYMELSKFEFVQTVKHFSLISN